MCQPMEINKLKDCHTMEVNEFNGTTMFDIVTQSENIGATVDHKSSKAFFFTTGSSLWVQPWQTLPGNPCLASVKMPK